MRLLSTISTGYCTKTCLLFSTVLLLFSATATTGQSQDDVSLLRKRVAELEAENLALRKVISEIQGAISKLPSASNPPNSTANTSKTLRIQILEDDWGESSQNDMQKVCLSSAEEIWKELKDDRLAPILVSRSKSGPISLYQRGRGYEYQVRLDTANRAWAQCAFQFSHEFCHILCNYRSAKNPQLWFEESLCELASIFSLRRMSESWKTQPPYPNWKSYAPALKNYADNRIEKYKSQSESLIDFYKKNKAKLEKNGTDRQLNGFVAFRLLSLFEKDPSLWQAVRYINLGPQEENESFATYLEGWYARVPKPHRKSVAQIAKSFGIDLD